MTTAPAGSAYWNDRPRDAHGELSLAAGTIEHDQRQRAVVRILERDTLETLDAGRRLDAVRARSHEAARVPEHVVLEVACDGAGRRVDGDDAAAIGAAARVRSVTLIERQIPEHDAARPAARRSR